MIPGGPVSRAILLALVGGVFLAAPLAAQFTPRLQDLITSPTKLDVVLVTFQDATTTQAGWTYDYHLHDLPHGYSRRASDGALLPGDDSYKMEDWQRLFGTPGAAAFDGKGVTVANGREALPEVFGSLREYFEDVSGGDFILQVRIINPQDANGYPRWVQLPETKGFYGEIDGGTDRRRATRYWDDARAAAQDSIALWYPGTTDYDLPDASADVARRRSHKVLYLYSGVALTTDERNTRLLHPQADRETRVTPDGKPQDAADIGFRYVTSERLGAGPGVRAVDHFTTIGIHVHEIGHLLGLSHPYGSWSGRNPYTGQENRRDGRDPEKNISFTSAPMSGWGMMLASAHGPPIWKPPETGNAAWVYEFAACPNPFNAVYRRDLGWNDRVEITQTTRDQRIDPGDYYIIQAGDAGPSELVLELRTAGGWGQYADWYRFAKAPGLLIWKEYRYWVTPLPNNPPRVASNWRLIPADGRSIRDARERTYGNNRIESPNVSGLVSGRDWPRLVDNYAYPWQDRVSDPFDALEGNGLTGQTLWGSAHRPVVKAADDDQLLRAMPNRRGPKKIRMLNPPTQVAVRNIRVQRDDPSPHALVDVYFNHWAGRINKGTSQEPSDPTPTWEKVVYVGGDVTIEDGTTVTIADNAQVLFLAPGPDDARRPDRADCRGQGRADGGQGGHVRVGGLRPGAHGQARDPRGDRGHGDAERGDDRRRAPPLEWVGHRGRGT